MTDILGLEIDTMHTEEAALSIVTGNDGLLRLTLRGEFSGDEVTIALNQENFNILKANLGLAQTLLNKITNGTIIAGEPAKG